MPKRKGDETNITGGADLIVIYERLISSAIMLQ